MSGGPQERGSRERARLPARAPAAVASPAEGQPAQHLLGNQALRELDPVSAVARGASLLRAAGVAGVPHPGELPLSRMRDLLRAHQADAEGLALGAALDATRRSAGHPLPDAIRARLETAFGHDFSHVRVHTDGAAADAAADVHALAFALGAHVFFGRGQFNPDSAPGLELLAHELTHVVQHDEHRLPGAPGGEADVSHPNDPHEREATDMAREILGDAWGDESAHSDDSQMEHSSPDVQGHLGTSAEVSRAPERPPLATASTTDPLCNFITEFNRKFPWNLRTYLGQFLGVAVEHTTEQQTNPSQTEPPSHPATNGAVRTDTTAEVAARVYEQITAVQRSALFDYLITNVVPQRLFNVDEVDTLPAEARIVISAHILAYGDVVLPRGRHQRFRAQHCGHWVDMVRRYARADSSSNSDGDLMNVFDPMGNILFEGVRAYGKRGSLPNQSNPPQTADNEVNASTPHGRRTLQNYSRGDFVSANRVEALEKAGIDALQFGDHIVGYNANASQRGSHSMIFVGWEPGGWRSETSPLSHKTFEFRVARVYSQSTPARGGLGHTVNLGPQAYFRFSDGTDSSYTNRTPGINQTSCSPITQVVTPDTQPAGSPVEPRGTRAPNAASGPRAGRPARAPTPEITFAISPVTSYVRTRPDSTSRQRGEPESTSKSLGFIWTPAADAGTKNDTEINNKKASQTNRTAFIESLSLWITNQCRAKLAALPTQLTDAQRTAITSKVNDNANFDLQNRVTLLQHLTFFVDCVRHRNDDIVTQANRQTDWLEQHDPGVSSSNANGQCFLENDLQTGQHGEFIQTLEIASEYLQRSQPGPATSTEAAPSLDAPAESTIDRGDVQDESIESEDASTVAPGQNGRDDEVSNEVSATADAAQHANEAPPDSLSSPSDGAAQVGPSREPDLLEEMDRRYAEIGNECETLRQARQTAIREWSSGVRTYINQLGGEYNLLNPAPNRPTSRRAAQPRQALATAATSSSGEPEQAPPAPDTYNTLAERLGLSVLTQGDEQDQWRAVHGHNHRQLRSYSNIKRAAEHSPPLPLWACILPDLPPEHYLNLSKARNHLMSEKKRIKSALRSARWVIADRWARKRRGVTLPSLPQRGTLGYLTELEPQPPYDQFNVERSVDSQNGGRSPGTQTPNVESVDVPPVEAPQTDRSHTRTEFVGSAPPVLMASTADPSPPAAEQVLDDLAPELAAGPPSLLQAPEAEDAPPEAAGAIPG